MAIEVVVPPLGESVTQAVLLAWRKKDGEPIAADEPLCELETDKANVDIPAPAAGIVHRAREEGATVNVGEVIAQIDPTGVTATPIVTPKHAPDVPPPEAASSAQAQPPDLIVPPPVPLDDLSPAVRHLVEEHRLDPRQIRGTGPGGRLTKEDVQAHLQKSAPSPAPAPVPAPAPLPVPLPALQRPAPPAAKPIPAAARPDGETAPPKSGPQPIAFDAQGQHRAPMSKIRRRIAERLVEAQHTAAILTTFNEVDMTAVLGLREKYKDSFAQTHGVSLGLMSFFGRAIILGLREIPHLNAYVDGTDIIYHQHVNLGIAVSTDRGLAVPVLHDVDGMSFARIEAEIKRLAAATREGKLNIEELSGATFTITNGGVFGSLLSTPILTPPQTGILGMHAIQRRPVAIGDKVEIRPMMYVALSYDHRLVDGREAITFLVRLKQYLEDPARLMLEV